LPILQLEEEFLPHIVMKVHDSNLSSAGQTNLTRTQETERQNRSGSTSNASTSGAVNDDVHLSELVRSLKALAAESPERQARLEQLTRAYASGTYQTDPHATASKIVDDALEP
jgi:flagellar biosynthesis anti-sigma factor FlgM